ncbi:retrovirus-related pol polyprotein from transposon TNT 1-94 [Tanacetum coccineum]
MEICGVLSYLSLVKGLYTKLGYGNHDAVSSEIGAINHLARQGLVRDNGTKFVNQALREYYEKVGISHETSVARSPQKNGIVERHNHTLIEAARTMLIYAQASLFLWAEAIATACYTQNHSIIRLRHGKTPYELLHDKLPDLSFFHIFGALCYSINDSENLGKFQPKADFGIFIGYAPTKKAIRIYNRRTRRIIETIHVDFDELIAMASEHNNSGPTLHEMTLHSRFKDSCQILHFHLISPEVIALIAKVVAPEPAASTASSFRMYSTATVVYTAAPNSEHVTKWTKDHPLDNIIVEPKNYKDALTQACWIEAMQEELNEFERLEVWELVPCPDKAFLNGILHEEVYVSQPNGFVDQDNPNHVGNSLRNALVMG